MMPWRKVRCDAAAVGAVVAVLILDAGVPVHSALRNGESQSTRAAVDDNRATVKDLEQWMTSLSNWGRWGKDDEVGAVNLITPEKRRSAAALVRTGTAVSLMRALTIVPGTAGNPFNIVPS